MAAARPVLYQLRISPFNEKIRWALDYKRIEHERRSAIPGYHQLKARRLAGGKTLPVLDLNGRVVQNSADIVAALEEFEPEPPLYPSDSLERSRALEMEAYFDDLGHEVRRTIFDELLQDPALFVETFYIGQRSIVKRLTKAGFAAGRLLVRREYGVSSESASEARERVRAALDLIDAEAAPGEFLVGDRFTVADLSAAAILFPLVLPSEYPYPLPDAARLPEGVRRFRESVKEHPGFRWAEQTWREHRSPSAELVVA